MLSIFAFLIMPTSIFLSIIIMKRLTPHPNKLITEKWIPEANNVESENDNYIYEDELNIIDDKPVNFEKIRKNKRDDLIAALISIIIGLGSILYVSCLIYYAIKNGTDSGVLNNLSFVWILFGVLCILIGPFLLLSAIVILHSMYISPAGRMTTCHPCGKIVFRCFVLENNYMKVRLYADFIFVIEKGNNRRLKINRKWLNSNDKLWFSICKIFTENTLYEDVRNFIYSSHIDIIAEDDEVTDILE